MALKRHKYNLPKYYQPKPIQRGPILDGDPLAYYGDRQNPIHINEGITELVQDWPKKTKIFRPPKIVWLSYTVQTRSESYVLGGAGAFQVYKVYEGFTYHGGPYYTGETTIDAFGNRIFLTSTNWIVNASASSDGTWTAVYLIDDEVNVLGTSIPPPQHKVEIPNPQGTSYNQFETTLQEVKDYFHDKNILVMRVGEGSTDNDIKELLPMQDENFVGTDLLHLHIGFPSADPSDDGYSEHIDVFKRRFKQFPNRATLLYSIQYQLERFPDGAVGTIRTVGLTKPSTPTLKKWNPNNPPENTIVSSGEYWLPGIEYDDAVRYLNGGLDDEFNQPIEDQDKIDLLPSQLQAIANELKDYNVEYRGDGTYITTQQIIQTVEDWFYKGK